jgi:hypothetical protein
MNENIDVRDIGASDESEYVPPKKYYLNGNVGVLITSSYGAGWSTWSSFGENMAENMLFDTEIIEFILQHTTDGEFRSLSKTQQEELSKIASEKYDGQYIDGIESLVVDWVPIGSKFIIKEYDGIETIMFFNNFNWYEA